MKKNNSNAITIYRERSELLKMLLAGIFCISFGIDNLTYDKNNDIVSAFDVLEHVEPEYIENVVKHLVSKFRKRAFITISLKKARETLPDGRNAHLIIEPFEWWVNLIKKYAFIEQVDFARDVPMQNDVVLQLRKRNSRF